MSEQTGKVEWKRNGTQAVPYGGFFHEEKRLTTERNYENFLGKFGEQRNEGEQGTVRRPFLEESLFLRWAYLLFEGSQRCCASAALISSSLKSGCAMEISSSARCHVLLPAMQATPYSVAI